MSFSLLSYSSVIDIRSAEREIRSLLVNRTLKERKSKSNQAINASYLLCNRCQILVETLIETRKINSHFPRAFAHLLFLSDKTVNSSLHPSLVSSCYPYACVNVSICSTFSLRWILYSSWLFIIVSFWSHPWGYHRSTSPSPLWSRTISRKKMKAILLRRSSPRQSAIFHILIPGTRPWPNRFASNLFTVVQWPNRIWFKWSIILNYTSISLSIKCISPMP